MDFDDRNRLFYVDISAACSTAAVSGDGGNTFPLDRHNPPSCIGGGDDPEGATDDRQWVAAFGDGIAIRPSAISRRRWSRQLPKVLAPDAAEIFLHAGSERRSLKVKVESSR